MASSILVLNGPNLNLLGTRQPEVYGSETLADVERMCLEVGKEIGVAVTCKQSNYEGELVSWIQEAKGIHDALVLNAGAYSHTSIAIMDAINGVEMPTIELHVSNIHNREEFRHHSYISFAAKGLICGLGTNGYRLAVRAAAEL